MTPSTTTSPRRHRSRRFSPWIPAALAGAAVALWAAGRLPLALQAAPLPGTASLTGAVDSSVPFRAAQVSIRNVDKHVLYMVYTNGGQFRAVNLFPGRYEVSAATKGFESETLKEHRQNNTHTHHGKRSSNAHAWSCAEWMILKRVWIEGQPTIRIKAFRFFIDFR